MLKKLRESLEQARKAQDKRRLEILTTLYSEAYAIGKNAGNRASTDAEVWGSVKKYVAAIDETARLLNGSGRTDIEEYQANLDYERQVAMEFMPQMLTDSELDQAIREAIVETGASDKKHMGLVMKALQSQYAGRYDGAIVSARVKLCLK